MALIAQHGYDNVTIEMITEVADVGKGTYFNYFATKDALLVAFFDEQMERLVRRAEARWNRDGPDSAWDALVDVIRSGAEQEGRSKHFARTLLALMVQNPTVRAAAKATHDSSLRQLARFVARAQVQGQIRGDVAAVDIAGHLANNYMAVLHSWTMSDDDVELSPMVERAFALTLEGIRPQPGPRVKEDTDVR